MAPEIVQKVPYDNKIDNWSLGCPFQACCSSACVNETGSQLLMIKSCRSLSGVKVHFCARWENSSKLAGQ